MTTSFSTFRTVDGGDTIALEPSGRYVDNDGARSHVASYDPYTFGDGRLTEISYTVEVDDPASGR